MIHVREAILLEAALIVDFQLKMALETENLQLEDQIVTQGVKAVFEDKRKGTYYVAVEDEKVIASLLVTPEWSEWRNGTVLWIQSVYVIPEFRRTGVFKALYGFLKHMVSKDTALKGLRLYVDKSNTEAQAVYEAIGMNGQHYQLYEWIK